MSSKSNTVVRWGILIVVFHLLVVVPHSLAHTKLKIYVSTWQNVYILLVIILLPILSAILISRNIQGGFLLLGLSMAGSLAFGVYYHFIAAGPDNVASVHDHEWALTFQLSAVLLSLVELVGLVVGVMGATRGYRA